MCNIHAQRGAQGPLPTRHRVHGLLLQGSLHGSFHGSFRRFDYATPTGSTRHSLAPARSDRSGFQGGWRTIVVAISVRGTNPHWFAIQFRGCSMSATASNNTACQTAPFFVPGTRVASNISAALHVHIL